MFDVDNATAGNDTVLPQSNQTDIKPAAGQARALTQGTLLHDRYEIERTLGQGGMGAVYLARHKKLFDRLVAIKEMALQVTDEAEKERAVGQFAKEAEILATLDHPGLTKIIDYFEEAGSQFLVMDFVDGVTLDAIMRQSPNFLEVAKVVGWMEEICDVLDYLHVHNPPIYFRDLKPSNVMLDAHGKVRLIDFGIAQVADPSGKASTFVKGAGTPGFAPPEQHAATGTDHRADIYGLGATMYSLLTRTFPPMSMALWIGERSLEVPHLVNPEVSTDLEAVILKMMALRKEDRYQSMVELRQALRLATQQPDASEALNEILATDELTGVRNRRFFHRVFPQEAARAKEHGEPMTVAALGVDFLKTINDRLGYAAGDQLLVQLATVMGALLPEAASLVRYGGDVFLVLMPNTARDAALSEMRRLCEQIRMTRLEVAGSPQSVSVTFSAGLASFPNDTEDPRKLHDLAQKARQIAKNLGRDRVSTLEDEAQSTFLDLKNLHELFPCPKVVGRDDIEQQATELLNPSSSRAKAMVLLEGEDGYGKSRMLDHIAAAVDPRYFVVVRAAGQPHLATQPFGLLTDSIGMAIRQDARLAARITAYLDAVQIAEVSRFLPALARFSGVQATVPLTADERKRVLVTSFLRMLTSWAGTKSLALLLDDFQWADPGTLEVLASLKDELGGKQAAIFIASHPRTAFAERNAQLAEYLSVEQERGGLTCFALGSLRAEQVAEMMRTILPALQESRSLINLVSGKSHGIPLLVEEIVKYLIQQEKLRPQGHQIVAEGVREADVPDDIRDMLISRFTRLDNDIVDLLNKAAVLGERFTLKDLEALESGKNEGLILDLLDRAMRAHIIEADKDDPDVLHFASAGAHQSVYEAIDSAQRASLHQQAAEAAEQRREEGSYAELAELSWHYEKAGAMERAVEYAEQIVKQYSKIINENNHPLLVSRTASAMDWPREVPLKESLYPDAIQFARHLASSLQSRQMYGDENRAYEDRMAKGFNYLTELLKHVEAVTFAEASGNALLNGVTLPKTTPHRKILDELVTFLHQKGLKGIAFKQGIGRHELNELVYLLCVTDRQRDAAGGWMNMAREEGINHIAFNEIVYVQVGQKDIVLAKNGTMVIKEVQDGGDAHEVYQLSSMDELMSGGPVGGGAGTEARLLGLQQQLEKVTQLLENMAQRGDQPAAHAQALVSGLASGAIAELQQDLRTVVGSMRTPMPAELQKICEDPEVLCVHLESGDTHKVAAAMSTLMGLGDVAIEPLFQLVIRSGDRRASKAALRVLEKSMGPKAVCERVIKELFRTEQRAQTVNLLHALAHYRYPEAIKTIGGFIYHFDRETRRAALDIIQKHHSGVFVFDVLHAFKTEKDISVRADAAVALGRMGAREAVNDLIKTILPRTIFFFEEDVHVQKQACRALGLIGDLRAVPALLSVLKGRKMPLVYHKKHRQIRAAAAAALGSFNTAEVQKTLKRATRDRSVTVRAAAKIALNRIHGVHIEDPH